MDRTNHGGYAYADVIWKAPINGRAVISARFGAATDYTLSDVCVLIRGKAVYSENIDAFYGIEAPPYEDSIDVSAGDTIEFGVGPGLDDSPANDWTAMDIEIRLTAK